MTFRKAEKNEINEQKKNENKKQKQQNVDFSPVCAAQGVNGEMFSCVL